MEMVGRVKAEKSIGPYSISDLSTRLSLSISSASDDGTLFDGSIYRFHSLKEKSLSLIQSHLKKEIFEELRQYINLYFISSSTANPGFIGPLLGLRTARNLVLQQLLILVNSLKLFH